MYSARQLFPIGNVLESIGIGPHLLKDVPAGLHANAASKTIWNILFVAAFVNGLFLISTYIITSLRSLSRMKESSPFELTLIGLAFAELIYLIINPIFFDRYVLTVSILFGLWFFRNFRISSRWNYLVLIVAISLPLILVSDFMKWQRSRNKLTNRALIIFGAKQEQIDGGFEYNAWHKVAPIGEVTYDMDAKSWWFVADDQYIIASTAALNNYKPIDSLRTLTWINPLEKVYILKRDK